MWHALRCGNNVSGTFIAKITFDHRIGTALCGFPLRSKGRLFWPRQGTGTYWSPEINAALLNGAEILEWHEGYFAVKQCDCHPYDWVRELYEYRKKLGKSEKGYPLKLGINSLYGKRAQRLGGAPYRDMIEAGLITAHCRAQLMQAYHENQDKIVMLATDGLFSTVPLDVDIGSGLGQWEHKVRETGMFIVQPGIYWSPGSDQLPRTRGIPRSRIIDERNRFEHVFDRWCSGDGDDDAPSVTVQVPNFIAHRLALAHGKIEKAGQWIVQNKTISFDWNNKREMSGRIIDGQVFTKPFNGHPAIESEPYDSTILTDLQEQLLETEAAPDFEPWGNSGE